MTNDTLRARLATLMKKSQKAAALYARSAEEAAGNSYCPSHFSQHSVSAHPLGNSHTQARERANPGTVRSSLPSNRAIANRNLIGGLHFGIDSEDAEFLAVNEGPAHQMEEPSRNGDMGGWMEGAAREREGFEGDYGHRLGFERLLLDRQLALQQTLIWKQVNEELCSSLRKLLRLQSARELSQQAIALHDALYNAWRRVEAELHSGRQELFSVIERDQFVKAAVLSECLAGQRARMQASKAALNELEGVLGDVLRRGTGVDAGSDSNTVRENRPEARDDKMGIIGSDATEIDSSKQGVVQKSNIVPFRNAPRRSGSAL